MGLAARDRVALVFASSLIDDRVEQLSTGLRPRSRRSTSRSMSSEKRLRIPNPFDRLVPPLNTQSALNLAASDLSACVT
jgi:hypothetical protein